MSEEDYLALQEFHADMLRTMIAIEKAAMKAEKEADAHRNQLIRRGMDCRLTRVQG